MGRPAKGSVFFEGGRWKVRVTTNRGKRPIIPVCDIGALAEDDTERAEKAGADIAREVRETGWEPDQDVPEMLVSTRRDETVSQWFSRWQIEREKKLTSAHKGKSHFEHWIEPVIGHLPIATLKRTDVERVVRALDAAIAGGEIRWKTADNIWGTLTKMLVDACGSKVPGIHAREDNPAGNVQGPDRGAERSGPYLYPSELEKVLACTAVPLKRRHIYALAVYTGLRRGELAVLRWEDIDLDAGNLLVHRAENYETGEEKTTKSKKTRRVPIEASLRELLAAMRGEPRSTVVGLPGSPTTAHVLEMETHLPRALQADLVRAGCTRAELFADDETRRPLCFHDLRHTYGTWRAIRGDDPLRIQRAMGHSDLETTQRYINEAETFDPSFGARVFAPLGETLPLRGDATALVLPGSAIFASENPLNTRRGERIRTSDEAADRRESRRQNETDRAETAPIEPNRQAFCQDDDDIAAALRRAIDNVTRRLASASDVEILRLVEERHDLRLQLRELEHRAVVDLDMERKRRQR